MNKKSYLKQSKKGTDKLTNNKIKQFLYCSYRPIKILYLTIMIVIQIIITILSIIIVIYRIEMHIKTILNNKLIYRNKICIIYLIVPVIKNLPGIRIYFSRI